MSIDKKILLDITDRQKTFQSIAKKLRFLNEGIRALYADYSRHIKVTDGKEQEILKLKENISYRQFSSSFHLELLLRQHFTIERRIVSTYQKKPQKVLNPVYPSHLLFDHCEREIVPIFFDSIIFYLDSIYTYLSVIIDSIYNKKDKLITKWSQYAKSYRGQRDIYSQKKMASVIIVGNGNFVDKLYKFRSRIIHKKTDINPISFTLKVVSGKIKMKLIARKSLTKTFVYVKSKSKTLDLAVAFEWLIHATIDSIVSILFGLKEEMGSISIFPHHTGDLDLIFLYNDSKTGLTGSVSLPMRENVKDTNNNHYNMLLCKA